MRNYGAHPYLIDRTPSPRRERIEREIWGLDLVSADVREGIVTAWTTTWLSSPFEDFAAVPFSAGLPAPLVNHVNEVTRAGVLLARQATQEWGTGFDMDALMSILILHDVDKPLLSEPDGSGSTRPSRLASQLQHGVIGAMLLKELGFDHIVVSHVALHAGNAPFHPETPEALVLYHADYFSADHVMLSLGKPPFYQKRG
jgi:putative nucleotidyltransferase with HDIG domain